MFSTVHLLPAVAARSAASARKSWRFAILIALHRSDSAIFICHFCPSVRLSVCPVLVLYWNGCTNCQTFFTVWHGHHSPFSATPALQNSKGIKDTKGKKILRYSTEIVLHLGNGAKWVHSYYVSLVGSHHRYAIDSKTLKFWKESRKQQQI